MTRAWKPRLECRTCNSSGFVKTNAGISAECICSIESRWWSRLRDIAFPQRYMFDVGRKLFDPRDEPTAYSAMQQWMCEIGATASPWMFLHGPNGTGKTHLSALCIRRLAVSHRGAVIVSAVKMFNELDRLRFSTDANDHYGTLEYNLCNCPILAVDDLAAKKLDERLASVMFIIVDDRVRRGLPTLFTSDVSPEDLEALPGWRRVVDRIMEYGVVVRTKSQSRRWRNAKRRAKQMQANIRKQQERRDA